jgi:hypothetical protein
MVDPREKRTRDKKLLHDLYATFAANRKAMFKKADAEELSAAIQREQKLLDTIVDGKTPRGASKLVGAAARRVVRNQLITRVPAARKIAGLNAAHIAQLYGVLQAHGAGTFDPDILTQPGVAIDVSSDFQQFQAPYDFSDVPKPKDPDLDFDGSYAVHQWGVFGNDIEFSLNHGHGDIFSGAKQKVAFADANVGFNCTVPAGGRLGVTLLIRSLSSDVRFDMEETWGPSDGLLSLENTFFVKVTGASSGHLHSVTVFDESRRFSGDDISGALVVIPQGKLFTVSFTTEATFAQDERVAILADSQLRAASQAFLIRNKISALLNWHLEKAFVGVV